MGQNRIINGRNLLMVLLAVIIAAGGIIIWSKHDVSQPLEIYLLPEPEMTGEIYVGGEVNNPGFYPLKPDDSIDDIIRAAGGANGKADPTRLSLNVPGVIETESPQKVNINRADAWLLQALPGIGEVRAQAIVDYRQENGPFKNINEIVDVEGMGLATFEQIKSLITVID